MLVRIPNWLGDALMATPVYRNLTVVFERVFLFGPQDFISLFSHFPRIQTLPYDPKDWRKNLILLKELRQKERIRQGLLLTNSFSSALIFFLAGLPERSGYKADLRGFLLTKKIKKPKKPMHQVDFYLNLLKGLGFPVLYEDLYFPLNEELSKQGTMVLHSLGIKEGAPLVVLAPGAAYGPAKKWPLDYYRDLTFALIRAGFLVLVVGGKREEKEGEFITEGIKGAFNLCGKTKIVELPGILSRATFLVSNDSGLLHLGAALKIPQIGIFGSTSPELTGPRNPKAIILKKDLSCAPCFKRTCIKNTYACLRNITPEEVFKLILFSNSS